MTPQSIIVGACIGSFFYLLMRLQPYLQDRTFDPKYNSAYLTRLVTGIVAGVILAYVAKAYLQCTDGGNGIACLSPAIVGILGGFSAEAVEQVLQRLVEVLLAAIRGDNSTQIQSKANAQQTAKLADVRDKLDALDKARGDADPKKFQNELDTLKALLKRSTS